MYISWLALFTTFGYASSFGVYQDLYTRAGMSSSSNISWIGSVQFFLFIAMGLPASKLLDKGYFRQVLLAGSLIYIFRSVTALALLELVGNGMPEFNCLQPFHAISRAYRSLLRSFLVAGCWYGFRFRSDLPAFDSRAGSPLAGEACVSYGDCDDWCVAPC